MPHMNRNIFFIYFAGKKPDSQLSGIDSGIIETMLINQPKIILEEVILDKVTVPVIPELQSPKRKRKKIQK